MCFLIFYLCLVFVEVLQIKFTFRLINIINIIYLFIYLFIVLFDYINIFIIYLIKQNIKFYYNLIII